MEAIVERDGAACVWCGRELWLGHSDLSFEHVIPRIKGGPAWAENEVAACRQCNRARGHLAPSAFLVQRGDRARREVIEGALLALAAAISERGGQRRCRPYLARELRRLGLG